MDELKKYIRSVPDFPKPGILFYDITTLFQNPVGFDMALDAMQSYVHKKGAQKIVGIEARGFILGGALADRLGLGFIPARKPGKLPSQTIREEYAL
ncbi:MAG: purine phosphoribosyltransferase family protein, partial [candidate division Zixibacteria bacterium]|nr:purine phosphoribosyltransferase family protein [candidate division Zixibacteria bacterium]